MNKTVLLAMEKVLKANLTGKNVTMMDICQHHLMMKQPWHHPDQMLFEFTKYGPQKFAGSDYKSIMPAYGGKLSDEEIWNVLAYIKSKWPKEIQKKHTEVFGQ